MTKEEAKAFLIDISWELGTMAIEYRSCKDGGKMREAIEALEQEDVIGKIREDVEAYQADAFYPNDVMMHKRTVLQIIDKHREGGAE